jgi:hypothetical protein
VQGKGVLTLIKGEEFFDPDLHGASDMEDVECAAAEAWGSQMGRGNFEP